MADLVIIAERADGGVDIVTPSLWILHRLQRNHPDYAKAAGADALMVSGNSEAEVADAEGVVDVERERAKIVRRGEDTESARSKAYLDFHELANLGTCTYEGAVEAVAAKDCTGYASYRVVPRAEVPTDRTYRNALKADLKHDMNAAREIHRDRIRLARAPLLTALDIEYQRADEDGDAAKKKSVSAKKAALRDATDHQSIARAKTIAALAAAWPEALTA